jgi:hypothetical protein
MHTASLTLLAMAIAIPAAAEPRVPSVLKADVCSVTASPFTYVGKTVEVTGIYVGDLEQSYLTGSGCASQQLIIPNRIDASRLGHAPGLRAVFRGTVRVMPKGRATKGVIPWLDKPLFLSWAKH